MRIRTVALMMVISGFIGMSCGSGDTGGGGAGAGSAGGCAAGFGVGGCSSAPGAKCQTAGQCPVDMPICEVSAPDNQGTCAPCSTNEQCSSRAADLPVCDLASGGVCRHCVPASLQGVQTGCPGRGESLSANICMATMDGLNACVSNPMVACAQDSQCTDPMKPFCIVDLTDMTKNRCVACGDAGLKTEQTCQNRYPDMPTCRNSQCVGCISDSECPETGICVQSSTPVKGGLKVGQCVRLTDVTVAKSPTELNVALAAKKPFIQVVPSAGYSTTIDVSNDTYLIGSVKRDNAAWAVGKRLASIAVSNGATLMLRDLQFEQAMGQNDVAIAKCSGNAKLYVLDVWMKNIRAGRGINAEDRCAELWIERTYIQSQKNAIRIGTVLGSSAKYTIFDNMIVFSGGVGGDDYSVVLGDRTQANGIFAFNTLLETNRGVECLAGQSLRDNLIAGTFNAGADQQGCTMVRGRILATASDFTVDRDKPMLKQGSAGTNQCIDAGLPLTDPLLSVDFYGTARGPKPDFGAQEVSPL